MESQNKDFALALYNKLWENINNKDTRLWTFLSIYGAAVALAFGAGKLVDMEPYACFLVLILTLWALFIVLNADWWDQRNRLMIAGIEHKFPEATKGVIPSSYQGVRVVFMDRLNQVSVVLLAGIAVASYLHTLWPFLLDGSITGIDILLLLSVLYLGVAWGCWIWVAQQERRLREYYTTAKELQEEVLPSDFALAKLATDAARQVAAIRASRAVAARSFAQAIRSVVPQAVQEGAGEPVPAQAAQTAANRMVVSAQGIAQGAPQPHALHAVLQAIKSVLPAGAGPAQQAAQEVSAEAGSVLDLPMSARQAVADAMQAALPQALQEGQIYQLVQDAAQAAASHLAQRADQAARDEEEQAASAAAVVLAAEQSLFLQTDADFSTKELKARNFTLWRYRAVFVLVLVSALFDISCIRNTTTGSWTIVLAALGIIAQIVAALLCICWAVRYYGAQPTELKSYPLRLFTRTPQGDPSWRPLWVPLVFCFLISLSVLLEGIAVYGSKVSFPLRAGQVTSADLKAEREALLEKWERLQKRSWDLEATERKKELSDYLKAHEAQQQYATKTEREAAARNTERLGYMRADEAQQRFATKTELEALQKALHVPKKGP